MPTESNIVQEFADGPTPDTVDAFGRVNDGVSAERLSLIAPRPVVAEGPLIKYNPGGFAQFRAETTGLPPARAQFGDQEFWGQLVTPTTTKSTTEPPVKPPTEPPTQIPPDTVVVDEEPIFNTPNYTVDLPEQRIDIPIPEIRWDTSDIGYTGYDPKDDPDFLEGDLISADRNFTPYTTPVTDPAPLTPRTIQPKQDRPRISITPKGIPKPEKDLPPVKGTPKNTTGVFKPTLGDKAAQTLQDIFSATEKPARILFGKTRYDAEGPLRKDERQTFDTLKKFKDWSDGLTEEQFKLWETKGIPSETTGRAPVGPKYGKMLADFGRILKNEENIRTQEYGDLQLLAALNTAALISQYGAIGGAIPVLVTASDDIMSGMNNMFAKSPELAGNPIQDFVHGTTWVLGKTLQKTYNNTIGQVLPKIKDTRIKDKLGNIDEFMKAPRRPNMGTKAVISMPDPDGTITIPEPETPTKRKQIVATEPEPFIAPEPEPPVTAKPIRVSTPTTEEIEFGDTPVSQTTSTRPEIETREALTVTPTTDTPTVEAPQGITIRDVGDITTEPPTRPEIETIGELRPTYSETARPITVAPITNVSTPQETFAENPQLTMPEQGIEQLDAKSITITPDGTITEIPKGITIEEAEDIVRGIDPQEIETADLNLRYRQPVEAEIADPIVVSPTGRTDEIEFAETPQLETPAIQPEVADPKSVTIQGGTDEKTAPKGITIKDVKDLEKGLTEIDTSNIETAELDLAELPVTKTLKGEEGQIVKPTKPEKQKEQKGATLDAEALAELARLARADQRQAEIQSQGFPSFEKGELEKLRDGKLNNQSMNWFNYGTQDFEYIDPFQYSEIQNRIADLDAEIAQLNAMGLYAEASDKEFDIQDLQFQAQNLQPVKIPSPMQFYANGYSAEESLDMFNDYYTKAKQQQADQLDRSKANYEQSSQDFRFKLADTLIENTLKQVEEGRVQSEDAIQNIKDGQKQIEDLNQKRDELQKQEQENAEKILGAIKGYLKSDRDQLVRMGLMTQEEADAQEEIADLISKTEGGLQILYKGGDGRIVPQKNKEGEIKGYAYISEDDAEFLEKYKGGALDYKPKIETDTKRAPTRDNFDFEYTYPSP